MAAESLGPGAARCSSIHCCCCKTWVWILKYLSTNQKLGEEEGCHYPELLNNVTHQDTAPKEAAPTLPRIPEGSRHSTGSMAVSWPRCPCGPSHMPQSVPHLHSWWGSPDLAGPLHPGTPHLVTSCFSGGPWDGIQRAQERGCVVPAPELSGRPCTLLSSPSGGALCETGL